MASRRTAVDMPQPQQQEKRGHVEKKKNVPTGGRHRRALGDIGNLVKVPAAAEGKGRPITRRFSAQLLAQAADKNLPSKKLTDVAPPKQRPDEAQVLAPKSGNVAAGDDHVKREGVARKKVVKSLTSVLSARSKAACGVLNRPQILNIDEADIHNELAQVEYVEDIYSFYKAAEEEDRVPNYMHLQPEINARMRSILVDWLIEVHNKFELMPETLYLTVNIVDRYQSVRAVARRDFQLVGISSMLIACKYEEIWAPEVKDFICISDNAYVREQILAMEKAVLGVLAWRLTVPTTFVFLVRYIKAAAAAADKQMENMAFFLAELGMIDYNVSVAYPPSLIAASAVYAASLALEKSPAWTDTLKHHTGYEEDKLKECEKVLISFSTGVAEGKLKASFRKYSQVERCSVALHASAKSEIITERQEQVAN
uniref:Cyclin B1 n=1 Tax=Kalanchoe fedtschenkoi TaxID=63787 RepID=A0A7N0TI24_KALFE